MMHEFSVTQQIIEAVLKEAQRHNAKKVVEVHLDIGKLTFLGSEQVRFSYDVLVKDTIMEGSRLHIQEKDGTVKCSNCRYKGEFQYTEEPAYHIRTPILRCPECGKTVEIVGGRDCTIKDVKLLVDEGVKADAD